MFAFAFAVAVALVFDANCAAASVPPELTAKIDRVFARWDRKDAPGVIVAIAKDGETIHTRAYGLANLEHGIPLSPDTISESGSVAKQFTAAVKPRGMLHTRWRDDFAAIVPGRAAGYAPRAGGGFRIDTPYSNLVGNGGLLTTVGDLLRWNASLDEATGEAAELVRTLQTPSTLGSAACSTTRSG